MNLAKQLEFIVEIDKLKSIIRRNHLVDNSRRENTAEHSWHIAMMAVVLSNHAPDVDTCRVVKMLLVHDIVEIDAGDTYIHDTKGMESKKEREVLAAKRLFSLLPQEQSQEFTSLWYEFEEGLTPEAEFANAIDRLQPFLLHLHGNGVVWKQNQIGKQQVIRIMKPLSKFPSFWKYLHQEVEKAYLAGWLLD